MKRYIKYFKPFTITFLIMAISIIPSSFLEAAARKPITSAKATIIASPTPTSTPTPSPTVTPIPSTISELKVSSDSDNIYFHVDGINLGKYYRIYIDSDNNPSTGQQIDRWTSSGCDYLIENGFFYTSETGTTQWKFIGGLAHSQTTDTTADVTLPKSSLSKISSIFRAGFENISSDWELLSCLPKEGEIITCYNGSHSDSSDIKSSFPVTDYDTKPLKRFGKGVIIPAYLDVCSPDQATKSKLNGYDASLIAKWDQLAEGAKVIKEGTSEYKDYWVVVNSGHNGPFYPEKYMSGDGAENADIWSYAESVWEPIRENGGVIFGYVHTCKSPYMPYVEKYRPLQDVKDDITAWVNGYSGLGGIWLDEFYPRYEIANTSANVFFPNGLGNSPYDKDWYNGGDPLWEYDLNPSGGYYDQLVSWIRYTYPNLRIIGNAGGWFWSNQKKYIDLADVTCSFEESYNNARLNNWAGLKRDDYVTAKGQLALIHNNSNDVEGAIDMAIGKGYTHIYTTDRLLENNIWGVLPSYFMEELKYIANHK